MSQLPSSEPRIRVETGPDLMARLLTMYKPDNDMDQTHIMSSLVPFWECTGVLVAEQDPADKSMMRYWWKDCDPLRGFHTDQMTWRFCNKVNSICIAVRDCYTTKIEPSLLDHFLGRQVTSVVLAEMGETLRQVNRAREAKDPSFVASPWVMLGVMLGVLPVSVLGAKAWGPFVADCCNRIRSKGLPVPPELHDAGGPFLVNLTSTKPDDDEEDIDVGEHIQMHNPHRNVAAHTPRQHQWREREGGRIYDLYKMIPAQNFEHKVASVKRVKALQIDGDDTWMCVVQLPERLWIRAGLVSAEAAMDLANVAVTQEEKGGEMTHGLYKRRPKITGADVFFAVVFALGSILGFATVAYKWNLLLLVAAIVLAFSSVLSLLGEHLSHWWDVRRLTR